LVTANKEVGVVTDRLTTESSDSLHRVADRFQRVCGTTLGDLIWVYAESEASKGREYGCYLIGRMTGMHNNLFEGESRVLEDHWEFAENLFLPFVRWSISERVVFLERWVQGLKDDFPDQVKQEYMEAIDRLKLGIN
jgi:hypothetical protein